MFGARTKRRELILLVPTAKRNNRTPIIDKRLSFPKIQPFSQHKHSQKRLRRRNEQAHSLRWGNSPNSNLQVCLLLPISLIGICQYMFVGNGFIRSERSVNIRGALDGNGSPFSAFFHPTCIPQKRYRAERINPFPTKHPDKFQFP